MQRLYLILFTLFFKHFMIAQAVFTSLPAEWEFKSSSQDAWMPATVPGTVHTDLMANGVIEDPYYRVNERDVQWIDKQNWEYRVRFQVADLKSQYQHHLLQCEGLDTYADVYLNGQLLFQADNFHRFWETDISGALKEGENELYIYFHSPIQKGLAALEQHGYELPAVNDQSENGGLGKKRVSVFVRKPGYHFGWDWGPRLVTSGVFRPIRIKSWSDAQLSDVYFHQQSVSTEAAQLETLINVDAHAATSADLFIYWQDSLLAQQKVSLQVGQQTVQIPIQIDQPRLWWSRGLGEAYLYDLKVQLQVDGRTLDEKQHRVGLRSVRVVQEPDEKGSSFYFELNGVPVFAKGANYIPNDLFLSRFTEKDYESLIQSAADANMNMLRVWGGGIYEYDHFYDLCDEQGIMVWQDFMFACSMYPGDSAFLESVRQEAIDNVRRLRNHASIVIWCGNNEIDVAWANFKYTAGWGWKQLYSKERRDQIWEDYTAVFHQILPEVVAQYHPGIFYWPSSPYAREGEHSNNKSTHGDIHYWGVWHAKHPFSAFYENVGRFMSEYGFQSFPELKTVKTYTVPEDWNIESEVMASHQRSGIGNLRIRGYMADHYQVPDDFESFLYVGQVLQGEAMKMAVEAHRSAMPYCMGSLYWQLNDCWPVASWSGMDYYQRWKAMHYFVKNAFEPLIVSFLPQGDSLQLFVTSDHLEAIDAQLKLRLLDFEGKELWVSENDITIAPNTAEIQALLFSKELTKLGNEQQMVLLAELQRGDERLTSACYYFKQPKDLTLPKGVLPKLQLKTLPDGQYEISVSADQLLKNLWLYFDEVDGIFSDNFFDLLPGEQKKLIFSPKTPLDKLQVQSIKWLSIAETMK